MIYAENSNGEKIVAIPDLEGFCPLCKAQLVPKCGQVNIWHWAHKSLEDCDTWGEGETLWHMDWKLSFEKSECEVSIGKHRADVYVNDTVLELQNSPISPEQIKEREVFYKSMIWLFNAKDIFDNFSLRLREGEGGKKYISFRWKHPRKSLFSIRKPLYLDFGHEILYVKNLHNEIPCGGWGYLLDRDNFAAQLRGGARGVSA